MQNSTIITNFTSINACSFTGKERDEETGFSYFGARYYDSDLSGLFLSVDPMADKYPGLSPYAYCAWDPLKATDPNGMDSIHTPNGIANAGQGYKVTEDGMYLYGEGLQTKKWNPDLEVGGVVGLRGGYENCDDNELPDIANTQENKGSIAVPAAVVAVNLLSNISTTIIDAVVTASNFVWIIPACLLVSGDSSPHQEIKGESKTDNITDSDIQGRTCQPFAHDTKKNGKLKGARSDRHAAQYNHGGKKRNQNPNQRKGASERRNKGKTIN